VIGKRDDAEALPGCFKQRWAPRLLLVPPRAHPANPGSAQVLDGVQQRLGAEIERVVVGERDAIDAKVDKRVHGHRGRTKVKRAPRSRHAALGDAALEVHDAEVSRGDRVDDLRREQGFRRHLSKPLRDASPEHRVACERQPHSGCRFRSDMARGLGLSPSGSFYPQE
jgi:hypothetical protein